MIIFPVQVTVRRLWKTPKQIRHPLAVHTCSLSGGKVNTRCQTPKAECDRCRGYCGGGLGKLMEKVALELNPEGCVCVREQSVGGGLLS